METPKMYLKLNFHTISGEHLKAIPNVQGKLQETFCEKSDKCSEQSMDLLSDMMLYLVESGTSIVKAIQLQ